MKKYSHAWLAFMAIKRLEVIATTTDDAVVKGVSDDVRQHAKTLWKWFRNSCKNMSSVRSFFSDTVSGM